MCAPRPRPRPTDPAWTRADGVILAALFAAVAFCTFRMREIYPDDALIVLRYAHQLLAGHGWTYNPGEVVNATTSPLYVMLVTLLGWCAGGNLMLAQPLAFALPLMVTISIAYCLLRPHGRMPAVMAGLLLVAAPCIYSTMGMESTLLVACALGACVASARERHLAAGILAGAAVLARPDAFLLVCMLLLRAQRSGLRHTLRFVGSATVVVLPWIAFAIAKFGSPLPNTMAIKLAQRRLFKDPPIFLNGAWRELQAIDERLLGVSPPMLLALFLVAGAALAWRARKHVAIAVFVAFAAAQFATYACFDLPPYHWYYTPALCAAALSTAVLFCTLWQTQKALPILVGIVMATTLFATSMPELLAPEPTRQHYRDAGKWLAAHTPPDASIAVADIGIVGFLALPRTIVDMQGLVTAGAAEPIARGDTGWWFDRHRPDYIVMHTTPWPEFEAPVAARDEFRRGYRRIEATGLKGLEVFVQVITTR